MKEKKISPIIIDGITFEHGMGVNCEIDEVFVIGRISLNKSNAPSICQNEVDGGWGKDNEFGHQYMWSISNGLESSNVTNLKLTPVVKEPIKKFETIEVDGIKFDHGDRVSCILQGIFLIGKISLDGPRAPYICQEHTQDGEAKDKLGFSKSWSVENGISLNDVEKLEILSKEFKEEAVLNNKILGAKMQSKIKATEAAITEREVEVEIAEARVEEAKAYLTRNVDLWIESVRRAKTTLRANEQDLNIAKSSLKEYENYAKLFPKK